MSKQNSTTKKYKYGPYYPDSYTLRDYGRRKLSHGEHPDYIRGSIKRLIENGFWNPEREQMVSDNFMDDWELEAMLGDRCRKKCKCCSGWENNNNG